MSGLDLNWSLAINSELGGVILLTCNRPRCGTVLAKAHVASLGPRRRGEPPAVTFSLAELRALIEAHARLCPIPALEYEPPPGPDFSDTFPL